jgi:hypothetical protein
MSIQIREPAVWPGERPASRLRPRQHGTGYVVAAVVLALAVSAAIGWYVLGMAEVERRVESLARASVPGTVTVSVTAPAEYVIYLEDEAATADVQVRAFGPDGKPVDLDLYGRELTYELPDRTGSALARFTARSSGRYEVQVRGDVAGGSVTVGRDLSTVLVGSYLGPLALVMVGVAGALVLATFTYVRQGTPAAGEHPVITPGSPAARDDRA